MNNIGIVTQIKSKEPGGTSDNCLTVEIPGHRTDDGSVTVGMDARTTVVDSDSDDIMLVQCPRGDSTLLGKPFLEATGTYTDIIGIDDLDIQELPIGALFHIGCKAVLSVTRTARIIPETHPAPLATNEPSREMTMLVAAVRHAGEICVGDAVKVESPTARSHETSTSLSR